MAQRPRADFAASVQWAPWAQVTPTWSSSGTQPALGNGSIVGLCRRIGTVGFYRGRLLMGSTTTYGTGGWSISLPDGWTAAGAPQFGYQMGHAECFQVTTTAAGCYVPEAGTTLTFWYAASRLAVTGTAPSGWAANHFLAWNITLELSGD